MKIPQPEMTNWNFSMTQSETLHALLNRTLAPLKSGAAALVIPDGRTLHLVPSSPLDIATLPHAAHLCHQYLKLGHRDVAIVNDPGSGGVNLSDITVVAGVRFDSTTRSGEIDLLLAYRLSFAPIWGEKSLLDEEGVRIPPTPLGSNGELNRDLLLAISAHPHAPRLLSSQIEMAWTQMQDVIDKLVAHGRDSGSQLRIENFKRYLSDSSHAFNTLIARLPLGSALVTSQIGPENETLKLTLNISDKSIQFDFAGTDDAKISGLTELQTFGACVAAIVSALQTSVPLNSGMLEHFHVSTPAKTMLSSRAPRGAFRGTQTTLAGVGDLILKALTKLHSNFQRSSAAGTAGRFDLMFADKRRLSWGLLPGGAAFRDREGRNGFAKWGSLSPGIESIEELEGSAPVTVKTCGLKSGSGGKGKYKGGDAQLLSLLLEQDATFIWSLGPTGIKHSGVESAQAGAAGTIEIQHANGTKKKLEALEGRIELSSGDTLWIQSSGGGGFGAPRASEAIETSQSSQAKG